MSKQREVILKMEFVRERCQELMSQWRKIQDLSYSVEHEVLIEEMESFLENIT